MRRQSVFDEFKLGAPKRGRICLTIQQVSIKGQHELTCVLVEHLPQRGDDILGS